MRTRCRWYNACARYISSGGSDQTLEEPENQPLPWTSLLVPSTDATWMSCRPVTEETGSVTSGMHTSNRNQWTKYHRTNGRLQRLCLAPVRRCPDPLRFADDAFCKHDR